MASQRELVERAEIVADTLRESGLSDPVADRYAAFDVVLEDRTGSGAPPIVSGYRDLSKQQSLYRRWRAGDPGVIVRPARTSWHTEGRAIDVDRTHPNFETFVRMWEDSGGRWGGRFSKPDPVHFDVPGPNAPRPAY